MSRIHQLSPHVADLIAAGEVVERPGSVAKELLENAVDAGAKHVTLEIQNGGMTFLRVTDDGCGMAPDDAETAFLRHATSKIREADDLAAITTMGFRGEALAAISSVSRIDLLTRTPDADAGTSLHLEAGKVTDRSPAGCPTGTTIIIRDLFYNTPARMKFMKSDTAESSNVFAAVQRQALSHPDVAFRFLKDGQEQLSTPGDGNLQAAIYCIFGRQFAMDLIPVESHWESFTLRGFVTKPTATRANRSYQHFFVGGRPVKSRLLSAALEQAYQNQMMSGRFPGCVLHLELPPHMVDVNVHPAKTEVRFLREKDVFDAVHYGVLGALNRAPGRPEMKLRTPSSQPSQPVRAGQVPPAAPAAGSSRAASSGGTRPERKYNFYKTMDAAQFRAYAQTLSEAKNTPVSPEVVRRVFAPQLPDYPEDRPAAKASQTPPARNDVVAAPTIRVQSSPAHSAAEILKGAAAKPAKTPEGQQAPEVPEPQKTTEEPASGKPAEPVPGEMVPVQEQLPMPEVPDYRVVGEVLDTYIIVEQDGKVLFLDKHAAHERILFESLRAAGAEIMSQVLLAPLPVQLDREETAAVLENAALLAEFGFEVSDFGGGTVALRQIPADLDEETAVAALEELAGNLLEGRRADPTALRDNILHTIACKAAIKAGWHTEPAERDDLVRQVLSRDDIKYCPHGRPVLLTLTRQQLERQFKRS